MFSVRICVAGPGLVVTVVDRRDAIRRYYGFSLIVSDGRGIFPRGCGFFCATPLGALDRFEDLRRFSSFETLLLPLYALRPLAFFQLLACLARFISAAGVLCLFTLAPLGNGLALGGTEILHEWDVARADDVATATFDAIEKIVVQRAFGLIRAAIPVKLLGQQADRANVGARSAPDAG